MMSLNVVMVLLCVVFFFQAEDGIRDGHVTGVQTCALPICLVQSWTPNPQVSKTETVQDGGILARRSQRSFEMRNCFGVAARSEERRVGKECRCWWCRGG